MEVKFAAGWRESGPVSRFRSHVSRFVPPFPRGTHESEAAEDGALVGIEPLQKAAGEGAGDGGALRGVPDRREQVHVEPSPRQRKAGHAERQRRAGAPVQTERGGWCGAGEQTLGLVELHQ